MKAEVVGDGKTVWVNTFEGLCIARFSRMGIDIHNSLDEQERTGKQCKHCWHGRPDLKAWHQFCLEVRKFYGVTINPIMKPKWLEPKDVH